MHVCPLRIHNISIPELYFQYIYILTYTYVFTINEPFSNNVKMSLFLLDHVRSYVSQSLSNSEGKPHQMTLKINKKKAKRTKARDKKRLPAAD